MSIRERFEQFDGDYLKFDEVENKLSKRRDLHAFMVLESLLPGVRPMISSSEHDEFYLDLPVEQLAGITDARIQELIRCGVRYDAEYDCLCMFT